MRPEDVDELKRIHEEFYREEFDIDVFNTQFLALFSVSDDDGNLITLGGVRPLAEIVLVTNKHISPRKRVEGLNDMLGMLSSVARHSKLNSLHAFVQDATWLEQLKTAGFVPVIGDAVHYPVKN